MRTYEEEMRLRKNLHPLLHFGRFTRRGEVDTPEEVLVRYTPGGYQRKNLSEEELISLSEWLYTLSEGEVINVFGFRFLNPEDATYYKMKWGCSVPRSLQYDEDDE